MVDEMNGLIPVDNIRSLALYLGQELDKRLEVYRKGTIYQGVRPSEVRVFVSAARKRQTISQIARALNISRQAVQNSVHNLERDLQVVELQSVPGNNRDKWVVLTSKGQLAAKATAAQIKRFESEFLDVMSPAELETARELMKRMVAKALSLNSLSETAV
jgi:DNA-binding MarR family transcriptional regulator